MTYDIPVSKIEKLEALLNRAAKKGGNISFTKGDEVVRNGQLIIHDPATGIERTAIIKVRCIQVTVSGSYKVNGWEFVGTIEHKDSGNIIRLADASFEGKIPERYNHADTFCEHCHTHRMRKDTYLIHNAETGEFKQVGRNCLYEYTLGLDADICASIMSNLTKFQEAGDDLICDYDTFVGNGYNQTYYGMDSKEIKGLSIALVKKFGYNRSDSENPTSEDIKEILFSSGVSKRLAEIEPDYSLLEEIDDYASKITDTYGYMYNAKVAWESEYCECRDFGLIASFVSVYLREKEREEQRKSEALASEFVGNVGDRIQFQVASVKVISYNDMWGTYYYLLKDAQGHAYIWSTDKAIEENNTIKATVKQHSEYKGLKQTVITRGSVIY